MDDVRGKRPELLLQGPAALHDGLALPPVSAALPADAVQVRRRMAVRVLPRGFPDVHVRRMGMQLINRYNR